MVKHHQLIIGENYKLDHINVGKFVRRDDNVLVFIGSQHGEEGENEIDADDEDEYTKIKAKTPRSKQKTVSKQGGGGKKRKSRRRSKRNKFSRIV